MFHILNAVFAFLAMGLMVAAMYFGTTKPGWYTLEASTSSLTAYLGIWKTCTNTAGVFTCSANSFGQDTCATKADRENRWFGLQICVVSAAVLNLVNIFTVVGVVKPLAIARALIAVTQFFAYSGVVGLFVAIVLTWDNCGVKYCASLGFTTGCTEGFAWPFWLVCGGGGCSLISLIVSIIGCATAPAAEVASDNKPTEPTSDTVNNNPAPTARDDGSSNGATPQNGTSQQDGGAQQDDQQPRDGQQEEHNTEKGYITDDGTKANGNGTHANDTDNGADAAEEDPEANLYPVPDGDWVYDEESGMYWSDENNMFFHRESGQFYDPESDMWFNEETGEWTAAESYE